MVVLSVRATPGLPKHFQDNHLMKKFLLALACAVCLLAVAQQRASAWCAFTFSPGFNLSMGGGKECYPPPGLFPSVQPSCAATPVALAPVPAPSCAAAYPSAFLGASVYPPPAQPAAYPTGPMPNVNYQPVSYPGYNQQGYNNYQVPGYWYGR
jgi:hypothetical protein